MMGRVVRPAVPTITRILRPLMRQLVFILRRGFQMLRPVAKGNLVSPSSALPFLWLPLCVQVSLHASSHLPQCHAAMGISVLEIHYAYSLWTSTQFSNQLQVFVVLGFLGAGVAAFRKELVAKVRSCRSCTGFGIQRYAQDCHLAFPELAQNTSSDLVCVSFCSLSGGRSFNGKIISD